MREIPLTRGHTTTVDDNVYNYLSKFKWHSVGKGKRIYARRTECSPMARGHRTYKYFYMHREILKYLGHDIYGKQADHINGDTLDNRLENLRLCSNTENRRNSRRQTNNTSGFKGVSWCKRSKKWVTRIKTDDKYKYLGLFEDIKEAALAYNNAADKYHGEFGYKNAVSLETQN